MSADEPQGTGESDQEIWRKRLADAESRYRQAIREFADAAAGAAGLSIEEAAKRRESAREEFHRVLRIFGDIVIRGKAPGNPRA